MWQIWGLLSTGILKPALVITVHHDTWIFNEILSSGSVYVNLGIFYAAKFSSEIKLILEFFVPVATYSWKNVTSIFITYITTITAVSESQNGDFI